MLCIDTILSNEEDCGSTHYLPIRIDNWDILQRYRNRWFKENSSDQELQLMDLTESEEYCRSLIGETLYFRSPETCCSKNGICDTCYGEMSHVNRDFHIGIVAILFLTSQLTQTLLSAKHLLITQSPEFDWPEKFLEYFTVDKTNIYMNDSAKGYITFAREDIEEDEDTGEHIVRSFQIDGLGKAKSVRVDLPTEIYITPKMFDAIKSVGQSDGTRKAKATDLHDEVCFILKIPNLEITTSIKKIESLIGTKDHLGLKTYEEISQKMIELLSENKIYLNAIHAEIIIRNLIRLKDDLSQRPDFTQMDIPDTKVLSISAAILEYPAVTVGLSFETLKKQLNNIGTFLKEGDSLIDHFFKD